MDTENAPVCVTSDRPAAGGEWGRLRAPGHGAERLLTGGHGFALIQPQSPAQSLATRGMFVRKQDVVRGETRVSPAASLVHSTSQTTELRESQPAARGGPPPRAIGAVTAATRKACVAAGVA